MMLRSQATFAVMERGKIAMRLIDADEVWSLIKVYGHSAIDNGQSTLCVVDAIVDILRIIDSVPTVDSETEIRVQLKEVE